MSGKVQVSKRFYLFACFVWITFGATLVGAQTNAPGDWTWVGGSSSFYQAGVYGSLGTPDVGNMPGSRSSFAAWVDNDGKLWLFGGLGVPAAKPWNTLNDLWVFDPTTSQWTWMGGGMTGSLPGIYGTLGTPDNANIPGARINGMSQVDRNGNFWLFGGFGIDSTGANGLLNDVWQYNPSTNEWTWMGGSNVGASGKSGVYGTLGTPSAGNVPGAREAVVSWADGNGHIWSFGGLQFDAKWNSLYQNDLWEFDPATNEWTWMGGNQASADNSGQSGIYGNLGVPDAANLPGGRTFSAAWAASNGRLWLFGGNGVDSNAKVGYLNDLWMYDPVASQWTWMGGDKTNGQAGKYGRVGTPDNANIPGARQGALSWTDRYGRFWMFGGYGYDANGTPGNLGDLWMFSPTLQQWTWMGGSSTAEPSSVYGTLGVPAPGNMPGGRGAAAAWTGQDGNFWLFGGFLSLPNNQFNLYTDLWAYQPQAPPAAATPTFSIAAGTYTSAQTVTITDTTPGATIYYTTDGTTPTTNSPVYTNHITVSTTETVEAVADAPGYSASAVATATYTITPPAAAPAFSVPGGTYTSAQTVTITDATPGAIIYFTTDGTTPGTHSSVYTSPITVSKTETVQAIADATSYSTSTVASATYRITPPAVMPVFSVASGTYTSAQAVTITDATPGAIIYYTTDGSTPTTGATAYTTPITVSSTVTLMAIATASGYSVSPVASASYTINLPPQDFTVAASPTSMTVTGGQSGATAISITPQNGFNSAVSFACSGLPSGGSCSFSPSTVTPSSGPASTTVTVSTAKLSTAVHGGNRLLPEAALAGILCFLGWGARRSRIWLLILAFSVIGAGLLTGCGGKSSPGGTKPPPVTSTVTITATAGSLQHSTSFSLTVD